MTYDDLISSSRASQYPTDTAVAAQEAIQPVYSPGGSIGGSPQAQRIGGSMGGGGSPSQTAFETFHDKMRNQVKPGGFSTQADYLMTARKVLTEQAKEQGFDVSDAKIQKAINDGVDQSKGKMAEYFTHPKDRAALTKNIPGVGLVDLNTNEVLIPAKEDVESAANEGAHKAGLANQKAHPEMPDAYNQGFSRHWKAHSPQGQREATQEADSAKAKLEQEKLVISQQEAQRKGKMDDARIKSMEYSMSLARTPEEKAKVRRLERETAAVAEILKDAYAQSGVTRFGDKAQKVIDSAQTALDAKIKAETDHQLELEQKYAAPAPTPTAQPAPTAASDPAAQNEFVRALDPKGNPVKVPVKNWEKAQAIGYKLNDKP